MSYPKPAVLRIFRNGLFALALSMAFTGASANKANAHGNWIPGAIVAGLIFGAIIHHGAYGRHHHRHARHHGRVHRPMRRVRGGNRRHRRRY